MKKMIMTRISAKTWDGIRLGYLAGHGLRELARAAGLKESSVTARASREKWSTLRKKGRDIIVPDPAAITPEETIQNVMAEHRGRFQTGAAKAVSKAINAAAELDPLEALGNSRRINDLVSAGCRLYGLGQAETQVAVAVLNQW
ncbi:MAG: hypothetical protein WCH98_09245 [Verrucomicrobiota bacterium]